MGCNIHLVVVLSSGVISLVYRNLIASIDKVFLIWQVVFPIVYIFIAGYSYSSLIEEHGIRVGDAMVTYPAYLAVGMIGFNVMNSSTVAGSIIWNDKRNGMFQQILAMPFTRMQYIASNLVTIMLMGTASASIIIIAGIPTMLGNVNLTLLSIPYTIYALITGAIFFGSITIIISTRLKSNEGFNVIVNGIFLFFAFASSAFYPSQKVPEPLHTLFNINPLTYVVDITRAGIFSQISPFTNVEAIVIAMLSAAAFLMATLTLTKMKI
jgi:ABC-2 type transport system permease protein